MKQQPYYIKSEDRLERHLGEKITLPILRKVEFGAFLGTDDDPVLLPVKQVPKDAAVGDELEVFLYKDSKDRLIATTREPVLTVGEVKALKVKDTGRIGAFLDWGLEKDLLLPFKEQTGKVRPGDECLVSLYVDKSSRLCATMKVYGKLSLNSPYKKDDEVNGIVYEVSERFGTFVAVDDRYEALIPAREGRADVKPGDRITARVAEVKDDGKLTLSLRQKAFLQMDTDAENLLADMKSRGGAYGFTDKADADLIRKETGLSKNAFKRAIGRLLKEGKVTITDTEIRVK